MPFQFNGAPPALLGNANTPSSLFTSFGQTATSGGAPSAASQSLQAASIFAQAASPGLASPFAQALQPGLASPVGQTTPFGQKASFGGRPASGRGTSSRSSFGQPAVFGQRTPTPEPTLDIATLTPAADTQSPESKSAPAAADKPTAEERAEPDDVLTRALKRAQKSRLAVIGRGELAADGVLTDYLTVKAIDIPKLLIELRSLESISPEAATFTRQLFTQLVRLKDPATLPDTQAEEDGEEEREDEEAEEVDLSILTISREHWRIKALRDRLQTKLKDDQFVHHEQGAKVFSGYLLKKFFAGYREEELDAIIKETLAREEDNLGPIAGLVNWISSQVWKLELLYRDRPISEGATAGKERDGSEVADEPETAYAPRSKLPGFAILKQETGEEGSCSLGDQWHVMKEMTQSDSKPTLEFLRNHEWTLTKIAEEPKSGSGQRSTSKVEVMQQPFRFLDLPAELRNWVYREQLAPFGYICLNRRDYAYPNPKTYYGYDQNKIVVESGVDLTILQTCRQVYGEAKSIMYRENTICVPGTITICIPPCIDQGILPHAALSQIASLTLVADHRPNEEQGRKWYQRVNWTQFQAMTMLKRLRICVVEREDQHVDNEPKRYILQEILERVPADCEVSYGPKEYFEKEMIEDVIEEIDGRKKARNTNWDVAYEVKGDLLEKLAGDVKHVQGCIQGCKSGHKRDYRFAEKPVTKSLQELIAAGEVDPSIVLGGGQ